MDALTRISSILEDENAYIGTAVTVAGWIRSIRTGGAVGFITLNDGSCQANLQIVYDSKDSEHADINKAGVSAAIEAVGIITASEGGRQSIELKAERISLIAASKPDYPLQKKRHSFEFLRQIAHLRPRSNTFSAVFRLRSLVSHAIHSFFHERGFVYVHTPIITSSDCEGAGEMFQVTTLDPMAQQKADDYSNDFFKCKTGLTVSGQLQVENFCMAFGNVYTFGPTFRAEHSDTPRHAAEFWMVEPEIAFAGLEEDMLLAEAMLKHLIGVVLEQGAPEMEFFETRIKSGVIARLNTMLKAVWPRMTYTEAVDILQRSGRQFEYPVEWGLDLQTEHERYLCEEHVQGPVFVVDYPETLKAFYMRRNDDSKTVAAMDLLVPGVGEIIGGSQREDRYDVLLEKMQAVGLDPETYRWYLDLRQYGGVPHAGFGLGLERFLMYVTGMDNIRDVIPFPRTLHHAQY